ncbi:hypothetical protein [Bacillus cereus]|nr:hypothetical protein [Bacillus cereus]EJS63234.1 hypothetical protein ICU_04662 [Bacillus cereus BAG2X1-1]EJS68569.1 hypothetical protein ICY_04745 [Bacillus cereus BAG2X1-3]
MKRFTNRIYEILTKENEFNGLLERILLPQACAGRSPTIGGR